MPLVSTLHIDQGMQWAKIEEGLRGGGCILSFGLAREVVRRVNELQF